MPSSAECICCCEIAPVQEKKNTEGVHCITGFEAVCLSIWVVGTAYYDYRQQYGENAHEGAIHE